VLPACVAWIVHEPVVTSVTIFPEIVQTRGVRELKLTARPEPDVALTENGAVPSGSLESAPKVIVPRCPARAAVPAVKVAQRGHHSRATGERNAGGEMDAAATRLPFPCVTSTGFQGQSVRGL
jgi:hypothetical protein